MLQSLIILQRRRSRIIVSRLQQKPPVQDDDDNNNRFLSTYHHQRSHHSTKNNGARDTTTTTFLSSSSLQPKWPKQQQQQQQIRSSSSSSSTTEPSRSLLFTMDQISDGPSLILGTGKLAKLTKASIIGAMGDTVVLTTVTVGGGSDNNNNDKSSSTTKTLFQQHQNFNVDYRQRHHSVGRIPLGTSNRRDNTGRPSTMEILGSRAIDRALRPLLVAPVDNNNNNNGNQIHIHSSVQGYSSSKDSGNPIVVSINSASAALSSHGMLQEPVAAVSLGVLAASSSSSSSSKEEEEKEIPSPKILINPSNLQQQQDDSSSKLLACELLYAGTRTQAVMAEFQYHRSTISDETDRKAFQTCIPDHELAKLMSLAHASIQPILDTQEEFIRNTTQNSNRNNSINNIEGKEKDAADAALREEENELRASLGLPPLQQAEAHEANNDNDDDDAGSSSTAITTIQQKAEELYEEAETFCESRLTNVTLALFGHQGGGGKEQEQEDVPKTPPPPPPPPPKKDMSSDPPQAYIHPIDSSSELLSKSIRGRREQIVQNEIHRILKEEWWIQKQKQRQEEKEADDEETTIGLLLSILGEKIQKKLFQKALCKAAIQYGTRADLRFGGIANNPAYGIRTIRPISITVPALPEVVHGSAIFARGETQVLCTTTLGAPRDGIPTSRDPFQPPLPTPYFSSSSSSSRKDDEDDDDDDTAADKSTTATTKNAFEDLPVGSLRYLKTQEALESDLNTRKSLADREMTGESGSLWENRRAFLQYDFPSFSTGTLPTGGGGMHHNRRAIGHGALAEKAILPVLPSPHKFPYTMRITSEVTDSNGSSSMASVCGASLALMDAGVPIITPVAGISVGLALPEEDDDNEETETVIDDENNNNYELLLDITGTEDYYGAMDFKIAGTFVGVTALQLDVKRPIPLSVLPEAINLAKAGRQAMLKEMTEQCKDTVLRGLKHRATLKDTAPRVEVVRFDPARKRDLIGPGGAVLRQLEDRYDVSVDLTQEGQCLLFGRDKDKVAKAKEAVSDLVADVVEGQVYEGTVVEIKDFGAIVELLRNKEGLLHVSELRHDISHPQGNLGLIKKYLREGDKIKVLCTGVDPVHGAIRLSVKALNEQQQQQDAAK